MQNYLGIQIKYANFLFIKNKFLNLLGCDVLNKFKFQLFKFVNFTKLTSLVKIIN